MISSFGLWSSTRESSDFQKETAKHYAWGGFLSENLFMRI